MLAFQPIPIGMVTSIPEGVSIYLHRTKETKRNTHLPRLKCANEFLKLVLVDLVNRAGEFSDGFRAVLRIPRKQLDALH